MPSAALAQSGKKAPRPGSRESSKQIARAVRDGKMIAVYLVSADHAPVKGWVCGADDYHWIMVGLDGDTWLIHKTAPAVRVISGSDIADAPEGVQERVEGFRDYIMREHYSQKQPA